MHFQLTKYKIFLRKGVLPHCNPCQGARPAPGSLHHFLILSKCEWGFFIYIPLWFGCIGGLKTIVSHNASTLPSFQSYDAPICNILIFGKTILPACTPSIFCRDKVPDFVWAPQAKRMHQIVQINFENYNFFPLLRGHIPRRYPLSPQAPKFCQSLIWAPPLFKKSWIHPCSIWRVCESLAIIRLIIDQRMLQIEA